MCWTNQNAISRGLNRFHETYLNAVLCKNVTRSLQNFCRFEIYYFFNIRFQTEKNID